MYLILDDTRSFAKLCTHQVDLGFRAPYGDMQPIIMTKIDGRIIVFLVN